MLQPAALELFEKQHGKLADNDEKIIEKPSTMLSITSKGFNYHQFTTQQLVPFSRSSFPLNPSI